MINTMEWPQVWWLIELNSTTPRGTKNFTNTVLILPIDMTVCMSCINLILTVIDQATNISMSQIVVKSCWYIGDVLGLVNSVTFGYQDWVRGCLVCCEWSYLGNCPTWLFTLVKISFGYHRFFSHFTGVCVFFIF